MTLSNQYLQYNLTATTTSNTGYYINNPYGTVVNPFGKVKDMVYDDHDVMKLLTVDPYSYPPDPDPRQAGRHGATLPYLVTIENSPHVFCICDCESCLDEQETCICRKCSCGGQIDHPGEAEAYAKRYKNLRKLS